MFKVGDTGYFKHGGKYTVESINHNKEYPIRVIDDEGEHSTHTESGAWLIDWPSPDDLLPPEDKSIKSDNSERDELAKHLAITLCAGLPAFMANPNFNVDSSSAFLMGMAFNLADAFMSEKEKRNG